MSEKKLIWKRDWIFSGRWTAWDAATGRFVGYTRPGTYGGVTASCGSASGHFMNADFGKRFVEEEYAKRQA